jgi:hypothetical protein
LKWESNQRGSLLLISSCKRHALSVRK